MTLSSKTEYYNDGKTVYATYTVNEKGHREGSYKEFTADGQLNKELLYKDGELHGMATVYYLNGNVLSRTEFKKNSKSGLHESYHQNGRLHIRCHYSDNYRMTGPYEEYTTSGRLIKKGYFIGKQFIDETENNKKWLRSALLDYNTKKPYEMIVRPKDWTPLMEHLLDFQIKSR